MRKWRDDSTRQWDGVWRRALVETLRTATGGTSARGPARNRREAGEQGPPATRPMPAAGVITPTVLAPGPQLSNALVSCPKGTPEKPRMSWTSRSLHLASFTLASLCIASGCADEE